MGPYATPAVVVQARHKLAFLALPLASAVLFYAAVTRGTVYKDAEAHSFALDLERLAEAHYDWVLEHGLGCARSVEHLLPYVPGASAIDPWGNPIALTCDRAHDMIAVEVVSRGPDAIAGTIDDISAEWTYHPTDPVDP